MHMHNPQRSCYFVRRSAGGLEIMQSGIFSSSLARRDLGEMRAPTVVSVFSLADSVKGTGAVVALSPASRVVLGRCSELHRVCAGSGTKTIHT